MKELNKKGEMELGYIAIGLLVIIIILVIVSIPFVAYPKYNVWSKGLSGEAQLREAEWNRQITIREAEARLEAEKLNAQSEIERAKGVAEANKIIGNSLQENEEYLRYLWVKGLTDGSSEVIYVPTEANLPILEARDK